MCQAPLTLAHNSCRAVGWSLIVVTVLSTIAFGGGSEVFHTTPLTDVNQPIAFSALRAYALSDRKTWLASVIILLALPPPVMTIVSPQLTLSDVAPARGESLILRGSFKASKANLRTCQVRSIAASQARYRQPFLFGTLSCISYHKLLNMPLSSGMWGVSLPFRRDLCP